MTLTPQQPVRPPIAGAQPGWYRLYFVLAAFNILTVGISLAMNHRLTKMYESSADSSHA